MVESMEARRLMSGPSVVAMRFIGTETEVTGIALTFNGPLEPASAQDPKAYFVGRTKQEKNEDFFDPFGLNETEEVTVKVHLQSATYDAATQTVTLTPAAPFNLFKKFRRIKVRGNGAHVVKDATGAAIDGNFNNKPGGDLMVRTRLVRAKNFDFKENDGDRASLHLDGPGRLWAIKSKQRMFAPVVHLHETNALKSVLKGKVKPNKKTGDGVATIHQLSGTTFASVPLLSDPAFRVEVIDP